MTIYDTLAQAMQETEDLPPALDRETWDEIVRRRGEGWTKYQIRLWFDLPAEVVDRVVEMVEGMRTNA